MEMSLSDINCPLVVDLDGTLINTDLLHEGLVLLLRKNPLYIFSSLIWMMKGKGYLKNKIFKIVDIPSELLPYNMEILDLLKKEAANGRMLVLATASPLSIALAIAERHRIFHKVYGTNNNVNLKGKIKLNLLLDEFGSSKFDYVGNSYSDLSIFSSARYSYLVNPSLLVKIKTKKNPGLRQTWNFRKEPFKNFFKSVRAYQWVKNLLIFVPLITSHSFLSVGPVSLALLGFISFSLVASGGYLINDLLDLNSDRVHPTKRFRPLASGKISILNAVIISILLLAAGFYLASLLNHLFWIIILFYFATTVIYSVFLKRIVLFDVFALAVLYSIRVFAGGVATNITLSSWLIAFSTSIFLSLAFVKRYSELSKVDDNSTLEKIGRGYFIEDIHLLQTMGVVSGFLSVVVFSLYLDSPDVSLLYSNPKILWITSFLFLFWISRIWMLTVRGKMTDDPIIFTLKDWVSYLVFCLVGLCILFAMYGPSR